VIDAAVRMECIHPLRNDFGSIAVIAPVLRQSLWKPTSLSSHRPALRRKPEPSPHINEASARASTSVSFGRGLA